MFKILCLTSLFIFSAPLFAQETDFILKIGSKESYIQGFRTYFSNEYIAPEKNLALLRELKPSISKVRVTDFTSNNPGMTTIWCRGSYPIYAPAKTPYVIFLAGALKNELEKEDLYSLETGIPLSIDIKFIDFDSSRSANWTIEAAFTVTGKEPVIIKNETSFKASFAASSACGQVTSAMVPAVQEFLFKVYSSPKFQELLK